MWYIAISFCMETVMLLVVMIWTRTMLPRQPRLMMMVRLKMHCRRMMMLIRRPLVPISVGMIAVVMRRRLCHLLWRRSLLL